MSDLLGHISATELIFLLAALGLALSFEFVNGFHDTANAVATVIYTHALRPWIAVVWSGMWNLIGVLTSSGAVAFGILALLPVELVINVGTGAGFAMVFSPVIGFFGAALLLVLLRFIIRNPTLFQEPEKDKPPVWWVRGLLILTCTGVSFAHGSNDGQKGMGLILLILIGVVPGLYALNLALPQADVQAVAATSQTAGALIDKLATN